MLPINKSQQPLHSLREPGVGSTPEPSRMRSTSLTKTSDLRPKVAESLKALIDLIKWSVYVESYLQLPRWPLLHFTAHSLLIIPIALAFRVLPLDE